MSFIEEVKRRNVIRVGFAYLLVAWLVAQVAELALDSFEAPTWIIKTILLVLALGFPIALILAWAFEMTPDGIKKEKHVDRSQSVTVQTGRKLDFAIIALLSIALVYFIGTHDWGQDDVGSGNIAIDEDGPITIAVLPFANLSDSEENAFFASGVHEDILTYLSKVADLRVTSSTTVSQYAEKNDTSSRDLKTIAAELGVENIVEGSVRRAGDRVRVTAQLIDARTDKHLWAENFDRDLTDIFEIQTAVAQDIVAALEASLSPQEQDALSAIPTRNIQAYDFYLKARALSMESYGPEIQSQAALLLENAVKADPNFALAHARLGTTYLQLYWLRVDRSDERLKKAKSSIDRAFELQPDLPEAHSALANYYYRGFGDFQRSLDEAKSAHEKFPNNKDIVDIMALAQRRLGLWEDSIASFKVHAQLDPSDVYEKELLLETMILAHEWELAADFADTEMRHHPDDDRFKVMRAKVYVSSRGDLGAARYLLKDISTVPSSFVINTLPIELEIYSRDYEAAITRLNQLEASLDPRDSSSLRSWIYALQGDVSAAREEATKLIEDIETRFPPNSRGRAARLRLAEAYVRLGERDVAVDLVNSVVGANDVGQDAFADPLLRTLAAGVLAEAGETDAALDFLEEVVGQPGGPTSWDLQLDARWDQVRDTPRFQELVNGDTP